MIADDRAAARGCYWGLGNESKLEARPCSCLRSGTSRWNACGCLAACSWRPCSIEAPTHLTALLCWVKHAELLLEKPGQWEIPVGQDCRSHWKRELVPVWRQLVSYQEIYSAREVHNTNWFFPLLPLLLLLIKKQKQTKTGCHIWYNTGSQRKAIVQQFLTTNTHLISNVALWKTQCMFGLFNASKNFTIETYMWCGRYAHNFTVVRTTYSMTHRYCKNAN